MAQPWNLKRKAKSIRSNKKKPSRVRRKRAFRYRALVGVSTSV